MYAHSIVCWESATAERDPSSRPKRRWNSHEEAGLRAALAMSQVVGLVTARHVVGLEALTRADSSTLVRLLAPVLQHYLVGDQGGAGTT